MLSESVTENEGMFRAFTDSLHYWRSKGGAEVDFVRQRGQVVQGFEAKAGSLPSPKLSRSARSFIDAYSPDTFFIVNMSLSAEDVVGKTRVQWLTPLDFLKIASSV